jgi:hypothetical protein
MNEKGEGFHRRTDVFADRDEYEIDNVAESGLTLDRKTPKVK